MIKLYTNRLIAINDMLNSPIQMIRNEGIRLFYELWYEYTGDNEFLEEINSRIQKREYLIQELKTQYPDDEKEIEDLREKLGISVEALSDFGQPFIREVDKRFYILNDQASGLDRLNYDRFADAFSELILNPEMPTPITIGIYGHWGRGKSFLMQKTLEKIKAQATSKNENPFKTKKLKILPIEFNAWSYSTSNHLWAGMVTHLYNEVEKYLGWKVPWYRFIKAVQKSWRKALSLSLFYILVAFSLNILFEFTEHLGTLENIRVIIVNSLGASIIGGSVIASLPILWSALREFTDTLFLSKAKNLQSIASRPDFHDQIGIMADIKDEINFISETLKDSSIRLVLFIDDLDRCDHKKAVEVLQAIMLLLAGRDGLPFMIFLGIDARVIVRAIEESYSEVLVGAGITGYEFLDKIIQLPFVIPPTDPVAMESYVESLIWFSDEERKNIPDPGSPQDFKSQEPIPDRIDENQPVDGSTTIPVTFSKAERAAIRRCAKDFWDNPRKIKRIVNMLRLVKILTRGSRLDFEKTVRWITLVEQWPLHTAWMIHSIEDDLQTKKIEPDTSIKDVFLKVKKHIHSDGMYKLFSIDHDPTLFEGFIAKEPGLKVIDILNLLPITFNLNPAIRWDVENYANRVIEFQNSTNPQTSENLPIT